MGLGIIPAPRQSKSITQQGKDIPAIEDAYFQALEDDI